MHRNRKTNFWIYHLVGKYIWELILKLFHVYTKLRFPTHETKVPAYRFPIESPNVIKFLETAIDVNDESNLLLK